MENNFWQSKCGRILFPNLLSGHARDASRESGLFIFTYGQQKSVGHTFLPSSALFCPRCAVVRV